MAFDFQTVRTSALKAGLLNTDFFAEEVTFQPAGRQSRGVTVKISHEQEAQPQTNTLDQTEKILVRAMLDESDVDCGGIADAMAGDLLHRSITRDPDRRPFVFTGEIRQRGLTSAQYVFERRRRVTQGRGQ